MKPSFLSRFTYTVLLLIDLLSGDTVGSMSKFVDLLQ